MFRSLYILIFILSITKLHAQDYELDVDTVIKYAVSTETKQYCERKNYEGEICKRYLTSTDDILQYQDNLNYFKILNEQDELLLEYLAYGYFNKKYCGAYVRYWKNGVVKLRGQYVCKTTKNFKKCNLKDGDWMYYNDSGSLIKVEKYDKGKLLSVRHV
ncbi:MAG: hypothetical protein HKN92_02930 [Chitinophagales bacterium]|nr:hypothetical protein [Chitinophagales bacterium]